METKESIYQLHHYDARKIKELLNMSIVDVVITSPPYFDMKDYGYEEQIGFGQDYSTYLDDLKEVFKGVYDCMKDTGSLWVIIDTFRRDNEIVPLPFDFAAKLTAIGWKFQEIIIWGKDKTVPWSGKGQMRRLFEYILVFSKTHNYKFYIDNVRQYDTLKKWWVRYPERYNPKGKTPEAIWNFPIPVQGAWGKKYIRHFCPLPEELIAQIIKLTTDEGDVVLDPFSGSGSVLAKADNMKRLYIGTELNSEYIKMFQNYMIETRDKKRKQYEQELIYRKKQKDFEKLIIELRALKYIRIIYKKIPMEFQHMISRVYVFIPSKKNTEEHKIASVNYYIECDIKFKIKLLNEIEKTSKLHQLSTFGLDALFIQTSEISKLLKTNVTYYAYSKNVTHKYQEVVKGIDVSNLPNKNFILSRIKLNIDENDFE